MGARRFDQDAFDDTDDLCLRDGVGVVSCESWQASSKSASTWSVSVGGVNEGWGGGLGGVGEDKRPVRRVNDEDRRSEVEALEAVGGAKKEESLL